MGGLRMLGAYGGRGASCFTTSVLVSDNIVIDAGNILHSLGAKAQEINHIFLTHSHMDHINDIPYLIDTYFALRREPLNIYGLKETIKSFREHIFNSAIWPDFSDIPLPVLGEKSIKFHEIKSGKTYKVDDVTMRPILVNHTVPCVGYVVTKGKKSIFFTSDTYRCDALKETVANDRTIKTLITECSFPMRLEKLSVESGHMSPRILKEQLDVLEEFDLNVYIFHLKPIYKQEITDEIYKLGIKLKKGKILEDGDWIEF